MHKMMLFHPQTIHKNTDNIQNAVLAIHPMKLIVSQSYLWEDNKAASDWLLDQERQEREESQSAILDNIKAIKRDQVIQHIKQ